MSDFFDELEAETQQLESGGTFQGNPSKRDFFDELEEEDRSNVAVQMEFAKRKNPEIAAKHYDLADKTGLPIDYIERNEKAAEDSLKVKDFDYESLRQRAPILADMLKDQRNAELAQQELDNLSWFEEAAREAKNIAKMVPSAGYSVGAAGYGVLSSAQAALEFVPRTLVGATAEAQEMLGYTEASKRSYEYFNRLNIASTKLADISKGQAAAREFYFPKPEETRLHPAVLGGIESAIVNVPAIAASVITKNPNVGLSLMGGMTYGSSYMEGKAKGLDEFEAITYGLSDAIAEVVPERVPLVSLLTDIDKNTGFTKMLAKQMLIEGVTEQITTLWQGMNAWAALNPEKTLEEFKAEQTDAAINTLISTIVATGLQTSAIAGLNKLSGKSEEAVIADIVQKANESNYRNLDKANFETYLQEVAEEHGAVENIYIDAKTARTALASMTDDAAKQVIESQIEEAEALNSDIVIPVGEFASTIATSPNYAYIKDSVRLTPDAELATINAFERIQEANKSIEKKDELSKIRKEVAAQLVATGKMSREHAKFSSEIIPQFLGANPERMGLTVAEAYEMMGLKIVGPQDEIIQPDTRQELTGIVEALKRGEQTDQTNELAAVIKASGIDINQDADTIINSLSTVKEYKQPSLKEEVVKSDPLVESKDWRNKTVTATLEDGTKQEINAGQAYDIIVKRKQNAQSILDCINANT